MLKRRSCYYLCPRFRCLVFTMFKILAGRISLSTTGINAFQVSVWSWKQVQHSRVTCIDNSCLTAVFWICSFLKFVLVGQPTGEVEASPKSWTSMDMIRTVSMSWRIVGDGTSCQSWDHKRPFVALFKEELFYFRRGIYIFMEHRFLNMRIRPG